MTGLLEYKLDLIARALDVYRVETVTAVVRRQHTSEETGEVVDVIDLYPAWNEWGTYGKMKVAHEYLDHDWQRQRFEKFTGVKVDDLPIYEGQQAMTRRFGRKHKCEVAVRPFRLLLQPRKDENGNYDKTLILRYLYADRAANRKPAQPPATAAPSATHPGSAANGHGHGRQSQPATAGQPTADWWELVAAEPVTPDVFDTKYAEADANYNDGAHVKKFRRLLFGDWQNGHVRAYARGLKKYGELRSDGRLHSEAKTEALSRYHRETEGAV